MLVPNNIYELIDDLIERSYTDFTYQLLGKDFLTIEQKTQVEALGLLIGTRPMLELIYLLVRQRSEARYQKDTTLKTLLEGIFATGIISGLPDIARATIDNASHAMDQIITKTKADIKASVKYQITQFNKDEANFARENGVLNITPRAERDNSQTALLLLGIGAALVVAHKAFHRDFTGELTTLVNQAAVDDAFETYGAEAKEVYCIKRVVLDNRTSEHCKHYYLNADGTPTVYKLKELIANGSNDGRPKSAWRAVCGKDHPRCRSQLIIIGNSPILPKGI